MPKRTVILPNGTVVNNVPEDVTDEEVAQKAGFAPSVPDSSPVEEPSFLDRAKETVKETVGDIKENISEQIVQPVKEKLSTGVGFDFRKVLAQTQSNLYGTVFDVIANMNPDREQRRLMQQYSREMGQALANVNPDLIDEETGKIKGTETVPGMVAEFVPYLAIGSKIQGARAIQQLPRLAQGLVAGIATDQLLADENENVFNLVEDYLGEDIRNDYVSFMAAKENDPEVLKRLKLVGEGASLGLLMELVGGTVNLAAKSRNMFKKSYTNLTPEEQGEIFESYLKESRNRVELQKSEAEVRFNETPQGAAQIQQQQSSKLNRVFRQMFNRQGFFTSAAQSAFDNAEYAQRAAVRKAEHIAVRLNKAMDSIVEKSDTNIADKVQEVLSSRRLGDLIPLDPSSDRKLIISDISEEFGFTEEIAEEILNARQLQDKMSREIMGSSNTSDAIKEIVNENLGSYMRRSYRLFEDTGYKPSEDALNDAREYIVNRKAIEAYEDGTKEFNIDVAYQDADEIIDEILSQGGRADRTATGDYFVRVNKINQQILKQKDDTIPPEIRALMGEIENPADNIVLSISKAARFVETSKFYNTLERIGRQGGYIFDKDQIRPEGFVKISGTNSNLDEMYTSPEVLKALQRNEYDNAFRPEGSDWFSRGYRNFLSLKGGSQAAKTVFSVTTHARNFIGATQFSLANGLNPIKNFGATKKVLANQIFKTGDANLDEVYEKYQRLGIINTNVRVGEFRALMESDYDVLMNPEKLTKSLPEYLGKKVNQVEDLYVATDDMFKVNGYLQELDTLKKAFPDRASTEEGLKVLEEEAADIIRNTFPNYDRVPKGIKALRNLPIGSFVSFPAEIMRTSWNILMQSKRELLSGNNTIRRRGLERIAGFGLSQTAWYEASQATARLAGLTEDERIAAQELTATPWSKDSPKLFLRIDDKLFTSDTQFLDSYSVIKEPIAAAMREITDGNVQGETLDKIFADALFGSMTTLVRPYIDQTILTAAISDIGFAFANPNGRTPQGKQLFTEGLSLAEKGGLAGYHLLESFVPGAAVQALNIGESLTGVPNKYTGVNKYIPAELAATFMGVRFTEVNPRDSLEFAYKDRVFSDRNIITVSPNFRKEPDKLIADDLSRQKVRYKNAQELYKKVKASIELIGEGETATALAEADVPGNQIGQLMAGFFQPENTISGNLVLKVLEKTPGQNSVEEVVSGIAKNHGKMYATRLDDPDEDSILRRRFLYRFNFDVGGEVYDVPRTAVEPDERVDRMTGVPYNEQAGGAFIDEEEREGLAKGGKILRALS